MKKYNIVLDFIECETGKKVRCDMCKLVKGGNRIEFSDGFFSNLNEEEREYLKNMIDKLKGYIDFMCE